MFFSNEPLFCMFSGMSPCLLNSPQSLSDDEDSAKRRSKRGVLPKQATQVMKSWLFQHIVVRTDFVITYAVLMSSVSQIVQLVMTRRVCVCALGYDLSSGALLHNDWWCVLCVCVVYRTYLYVYLMEPHPDLRAKTSELQMRAVARSSGDSCSRCCHGQTQFTGLNMLLHQVESKVKWWRAHSGDCNLNNPMTGETWLMAVVN